MFSILWMLFVAWFLQLFGFNSLVINGMAQVFGVEIGMAGYYFIFILLGMLKVFAHAFGFSGRMVKLSGDLEDLSEKLK